MMFFSLNKVENEKNRVFGPKNKFFSLAELGGTPPPLTESPLSFSGKFFPKRAKNDVFFI